MSQFKVLVPQSAEKIKIDNDIWNFKVAAFIILAMAVFMFFKEYRHNPSTPLLIAMIFLVVVAIALRLTAYGLGLEQKPPKAEEVKPFESNPLCLTLKTQTSEVILNNPFRGILVIGAAGSGKSESVAVPLLSEYIKKDYSGLVYDFKFPSLANDVQKLINEHKANLKHYYLDFNNPLKSYRVNPLHPDYLENVNYAKEYAQALVSNLSPESNDKKDYWTRSATDLLTACIWYLHEEHPQYCTIPHVFALVTSNDTALLEMLHTNVETAQMTIGTYNAMKRGADSQLSGVIGTLQSLISQINTPDLMFIFSGNDFSLDVNNPRHPIVLTVGSFPTLTQTFAPLCSLIITVATKIMNQPNKQQSFVMLDESPTVFVPNLEVLPNTGRDNLISTVLMVQDLAQLVQGYGQTKADVLFAACNNHFYGRVSSSKTAETLSKQFGKYDSEYITTSYKTKNDETQVTASETGDDTILSRSQSVQERDVIKGADFLKLQSGDFVTSLVESNQSGYFKDRFTMIQRTIPKNQIILNTPNHSREDIKANYLRIRQEVDEILSLSTHSIESEKMNNPFD